jgi:sugar/nucleoside kinase (ribokinase family)
MIACIGGAHIDRRGMLRAPSVIGTSNPGEVCVDFGGVARNVAHNLARLDCAVTLVSRVGDDESGRSVVQHVTGAGIDASLFTTSGRATASYTAILESTGELVIGLADMDIYDEMTPELLAPILPRLRGQALWFLECNLPEATIAWLLDAAGEIPVAVDAISIAKSRKLTGLLGRIPLLFCNTAQAGAMGLQTAGIRAGVISAGARGIAVWWDGQVVEMPALPARPRDVTGAGDALVSGTLYGLSQGLPLVDAARWGLAAAAITVESEFAAVPGLTRQLLEARL